jgi:hypothetical protein
MRESDLLDAADHIIVELDALEGDADYEPWLGFLEPVGWCDGLDQRRGAAGANDDREEQCEGEGDMHANGCLE